MPKKDSYIMLHRCLFTFTTFIICVGIVGCTQKSNPTLQPYLSCNFDDNLKIVEVNSRKCSEPFRIVEAKNGERRISVLEGSRLMLKYPGREYYFANIKVEKSVPSSYEQDKKFLLEQLNSFSPTLQHNEINGFMHFGKDAPDIDLGETVGMHFLFSNNDKTIITIYFFNQGKEGRIFNSYSEYQSVRDNFLDNYTKCILPK